MTIVEIDTDGDMEITAKAGHLTLRAFQVGDIATWEFGVDLDVDGWDTALTGYGVIRTLKLLAPAAYQIKAELENNGVKRHTFADSETRRTRVWERLIPWMRHEG